MNVVSPPASSSVSHADIRIILMSGYPSRGVDNRGEIPEGVPLLQKPLDPKTLARNVRAALDNDSPAATNSEDGAS